MKKLLLLCFISSFFFYGCENYKTQYELSNHKIDSLLYAADIKDSSINSFMASLNEIESNLDTIANKKSAIEQSTSQPGELKTDQRERINEDIRVINELLQKNILLVEKLQKKARSQGHKISELNKLVDNLNKRIGEKDTELVVLKLQLDDMKMNVENLNVTIDTLTAQNVSKENALNENIEKLHTAYYITGTYKELREKNIVDKEGGFLGMGKNQLLKKDFNGDAFTKIDYTKTMAVELNCKNAKIITNHPSTSYSLDKDKDKVKSLTITDGEKFWAASKYLVIVKD